MKPVQLCAVTSFAVPKAKAYIFILPNVYFSGAVCAFSSGTHSLYFQSSEQGFELCDTFEEKSGPHIAHATQKLYYCNNVEFFSSVQLGKLTGRKMGVRISTFFGLRYITLLYTTAEGDDRG